MSVRKVNPIQNKPWSQSQEDLIKRIEDGWLPLFACDDLLWTALRLACSDGQVLNDLRTLFFAEKTAPEPRALFQYFFNPARSPTVETRDCIAGFCLRNGEERLRCANERQTAIVAQSADLEILDAHTFPRSDAAA